MHTPIKTALLFTALFTSTLVSRGDDATAPVTPDAIKAPTSPAFDLVGISPTKIDHPGSVKAFGAAILNASAGGANNVALQFAPYWWGDRSKLTWEAYEASNLEDVIAQTATISIATYSKAATATVAAYNGVGLGFSCDLLRGKFNPDYVNKLRDLQKQAVMAGGFNGQPSDAQLKQLTNLALGFDGSRLGSSLMFSAAAAYKYSGQLLDAKVLDRYGGWLTYGYKPSADSGPLKTFTILASVRSIRQRATPTDQKYTDYGSRILWRPAATPVTASFEYMKRTGDARDETVNFALQYQISDTLYVFLSHGDALKGDGASTGILTVAGLNVSWGNAAKVNLQAPTP